MVKLFCAVVGVGSVFSVNIELSETVDDLKKKIKEEKPGLINFDADLLKLYLAREGDTWLNSKHAIYRALKKGEIPDGIKSLMQEELLLDEAATLDDEEYFRTNFKPRSRDIHVLVELPDQAAEDRPSPSASIHSENRRKRWRELNDILDKNKKAKTNGEDSTSTGYSYVQWGQVKSVLGFERYKQERKPIPDDTFKFLVDYLKYASEAMNGYTDASREAKRYHFIAPVLIMLCSLFDDVKLEVEETVDGNEWTLDISRVNITRTLWVDAVTIESKWISSNQSIYGAGPGNWFGTTTPIQMAQANTKYPDAQVHGYAICSSFEGVETLYSKVGVRDPAFTRKAICEDKSNTSMYVFSSGRHFEADGFDYECKPAGQPQNLSTTYNATCDVSGDGCMGLDAELADSKQRLLVSTNALPLDKLANVKTFLYSANKSTQAPQQPLQIVLVRRPTEVKGHTAITNAPFRAKYKDLVVARWIGTKATHYLGDPVLPHNMHGSNTGNKSEWDSLQHDYCSAVYDRRILNYVNNHLYLETTLQPTYTAAAFFLFKNGMARDVLLVRLHVMTAPQGHRVAVTAPHQIARVMVDDTTFPSLLLKRHIHDSGVTGDAHAFHIHDVTVRSFNDKTDNERV